MEETTSTAKIADKEKAKARDIITAIRTLRRIEQGRRQATSDEQTALARFAGFGPVALSLFPDRVALMDNPNHPFGGYKNAGWQILGDELKSLLNSDEYESARHTTFNAFYTSPTVIAAMHDALSRLGVPANATVLEPGCGIGNFMSYAPVGMHFIGVEKDGLSGRIARVLHPTRDIRIEAFQDSRLPVVDAVIGNPPFGKVDLKYGNQKLPLHDYFITKSVDALKPGGVLAVVTTHYTLDKQNAGVREQLASKADFLGAIRLPSDAFSREGTAVVTDIVFLRKRANGQTPNHADPAWLETAPMTIEDANIPINKYFHHHPEMVLGAWSRKDRLYDSTYSVTATGDLAQQLATAIERLPKGQVVQSEPERTKPPPFVSPPQEPHIAEGSFFVGPGRAIHQVESGTAHPVTYGGTALKADGTMTGKRIAALVGLRDLARRVLQSQNDDWPEANRNAARKELNRSYDLFVSSYGPINKTTFSETADGTVTRRMPNLAKFRDDPDAMLVMSLEDYDEVTGKAAKAAIMKRDVVGRTPAVTHVASAEEGLLVVLNQRGTVDLEYIAGLYGKPEAEVIAELGDLVYQDPESKAWQTADEYLSGNVREKLKTANAAGTSFARNAEALALVQPEDVLPGDIDANLGAPWIPTKDIQSFAAELFKVAPASVPIGHLKKDAVWTVDADFSAQQSVAATAEFGTPRANGTWLFEMALNLKSPVIYDTVMNGDREERVVNQDATLAAREKQKLIKERFKSWVFSDPDRTEKLVRLYNDTYNNLRPRIFDGSHLDFPGMNTTITLRPHQDDAVWRGMSAGNTLLAHAVGAGKTFTMAATGMKMKQAGLVKKPMYVVPNHMLEQFSREFMQLYPNAKLLVASKDDLARDRRKLLTAKIASGEWDGIIVTHSSFERIGMSRDYQEQFLREQIAEYDHLLLDTARADTSRGNRNITKAIEKQKANREAKLKDLLAEDKKDDGLVFDELGVDHLFIDEAHYFKNLETPTKMDRVAGIQTGGSERAFDLYMKARYLGRQHPGHGVTFATGTPISNTMVELYTMQRFIDPEGLKSRGIEHFDGWAANFCEVEERMELSPDGKTLKPRSRVSRFVNLPELQQMFRAYSDVQTAPMLNLPTPRLEGGKPMVVACPMSEEQATLQQGLVARYERLRSQKVDPREDNALAITTDGRKLALDARLLASGAEDFPGSKINAMVANVAATWQKTATTRGTQMIFCDMGVNPTPSGFCVYDDVIAKLVQAGIPKSEIAAVGDADSDAKKQSLFERVRSGSVRVLIGSTQKMGTGTNVQKRLVALHHLDAPWKPAEVEQREGRILRQGNTNEEVAIYRYVTEGSFDAYMWQALETKARFISQVMTGEAAVRRAEDIGGQELSYAEVKAIASGNPAVLTLAEADAELQRLAILKRNHGDEQYLAGKAKRELPETIVRLTRRVGDLEADLATTTDHESDSVTIGDRPCGRSDVPDILRRRLDALPDKVRETKRFPIGRYRGLDFGIVLHLNGAADVYLEGAATRHGMLSRDHQGPRAVLNALERLSDTYGGQLATARRDLEIATAQLRDYEARLGQPFEQKDYQEELTALRDQLKTALSGGTPEASGQAQPTAADLAQRIQELKSSHTIEATPERPRSRNASAAEAITARIRRRTAKQPSAEPIPEDETTSGPVVESAAVTSEAGAPASLIAAIPDAFPAIPAEPLGPELEVTTHDRQPDQQLSPAYRERFTRGKAKSGRQLTLF
jgi:N12 class adenine-specific DNA methylase